MAFCQNCGFRLRDGAKFCENCGNSVMSSPSSEQIYDNSSIYNSNTTPNTPQKKKSILKKWWFWVLIVLLISAFFNGSEDDEKNSSSSTEKGSTSSQNVVTEIEEETKENYMEMCSQIPYDDVARCPDDYEGTNVKFEGKVIQVSEGSSNRVTLRIASNGNYDEIWYVNYKREDSEARILEDDKVTVFGEIKGLKSYTSVLGSRITIPEIDAKYIVIGKIVDGNVITFDSSKVAEQLEITEYIISNSYYSYCYFVVENNSEFDVKVSINAKLYNNQGNLVGVDDDTESCLPSGFPCVMSVSNDEEFVEVKYEIDVTESESYYRPANEYLLYSVEDLGNKLIVTMENTGTETITSADATILFFKNGEPVGVDFLYFSDNDYELKPKNKKTEESSLYGISYDDYIIIPSGYLD